MADIFVSYASENREAVAELVAALEDEGLTVWWDRELRGGAVYAKKIEEQTQSAKAIVVVWTEQSMQSSWVADEAAEGRDGAKLVPVTLDGSHPPIGFRQFHTIDLSSWQRGDAAFSELLKAVHHFVGNASGEDAVDASIAVLPFVNMSADPEQDYFADGISEELLNLLAKIDGLRVAARTSSFKFRGEEHDIKEIGEALSVAYVLEGSVRKAGNRVRITGQLIEVETGYHLWSETYDRTLDDIFAIQDEVSAAVVQELKELLLPETKAPVAARSDNLEAYEIYLLGRKKASVSSNGPLTEALSLFESVLELDPDYAPALVDLARVHLLLSHASGCYGFDPIDLQIKKATPLLERAEAVAGEIQGLHETWSLLHHLSHDEMAATTSAKRALELYPNSEVANNRLMIASIFGGDPASDTVRPAMDSVAINPISVVALGNAALLVGRQGNMEEADRFISRMERLEPNSIHTYYRRSNWLELKGRLADSLELFVTNEEHFPDALSVLANMRAPYYLGEGEAVGQLDASLAAHHLITIGDFERAETFLGVGVDRSGFGTDYVLDVVAAELYSATNRYWEALDLLQPYEKINPEQWGHHYTEQSGYLGAMLSYFVRKKLGEVDAGFWLEKLKRACAIRRKTPDQYRTFLPYSEAFIAQEEGRMKDAVSLLEEQEKAEWEFCLTVGNHPMFEPLAAEAGARKVVERSLALLTSEREKALKRGLLPLDKAKYDAFAEKSFKS